MIYNIDGRKYVFDGPINVNKIFLRTINLYKLNNFGPILSFALHRLWSGNFVFSVFMVLCTVEN